MADQLGAGSSRKALATTNWFCFMQFISSSSRLGQGRYSGGGGDTEEEREKERREGNMRVRLSRAVGHIFHKLLASPFNRAVLNTK